MPDIYKIKQALELLIKYKPNHPFLAAEHDAIFLPQVDLSQEDKETLEGLGFHYDETLECWEGFV